MFIVPCPSCGRCGCECGRLPYTVTATLSGLAQRNRTAECKMTLSACFGSGAQAVVMQPGGCTNTPTCGCNDSDAGPITEVLITDGGSCYAVPGREEPEVIATVVSDSGSGAELGVTLTEGQDECGLPVWAVTKVKVIEKGIGYEEVPSIVFAAINGSRKVEAALGFVSQMEAAEPPSLSVSSLSGIGAVFVVSTKQTGFSPDRWSISSVAVTKGGSGYFDGQSLSVDDYEKLFVDAPAELVLRTARAAPTLQAFPVSGGVDAAITITTSQTGFDPGLWSADTVGVSAPGSGYIDGDLWIIYATEGISVAGGTAVATVDQDGGLLSLSVTDGGQFYVDTGVAESVDVIQGGSYYQGGGGIEAVTVTLGGQYYRENHDLPPHVADVTVTPCGGGNGALITATVDDDADSDTFGQVIALDIVDGGDDYLSWTWDGGCLDRLNGESIVLRAQDPHVLVTLEVQSCYGSGACLEVKTNVEPCGWDGSPTALPGVVLTDGGEGYAKRGRVEPTLSLSATPGSGAAMTPTLTKKVGDCGLHYWYIDSVDVEGGTDYANSSKITVEVVSGVAEEAAYLTLKASDGVPTEVLIQDAGKYYLESNAVAAYTPNLKVAVVQLPPSNGSGAAVTVTVNTNPLDGNFGKINGVSLTSAGSGYLLLGGPKQCEYEGACNTSLKFNGKSVAGLLTGVFNESPPQPDCDNIESETTIQRGLTAGTVNVEAGGEWSSCVSTDCGECPSQAECGASITLTIELCDEEIEFTIPVNGGSYESQIVLEVPVAVPPEPQQGSGYIFISASSGCMVDGCGYQVGLLLCYACRRPLESDPINSVGEVFRGCITADEEDGCPVTGNVEMSCLSVLAGCGASVTAEVS